MRHLWLVLTMGALALMLAGLTRHPSQWVVVKAHADALCTACIGLTTE